MNSFILWRRALTVAVLSSSTLLGACASTKSVEEARAVGERAQATADQALAEARAASDKASAVDAKLERMYQASLKK